MEKKYKEMNGTFFDANTPDQICSILSSAVHTSQRLRVFYGDTKTGKDWNEEYDTIGYIGRSTGKIKIPLLIHNAKSFGGPAILDNCIVKITEGKKVLYQHEKYNTEHFTSKNEFVFRGKDIDYYAKLKNENAAKRFAEFMNGERNAK